ncbi:UNKNOWN [Stylonychia lemnae]|uniref:Cyclic nucleotide-binding domain-containing protein n=1 Tax=Stylonychia lemnae TaxID=5949 RepID=A0A078B9K2_STYLE|nr:UNKNOWN [Stylonychia lemnae]|eukprot:CDW91109.1 UNKNOWN [Stylonychia lemnae]
MPQRPQTSINKQASIISRKSSINAPKENIQLTHQHQSTASQSILLNISSVNNSMVNISKRAVSNTSIKKQDNFQSDRKSDGPYNVQFDESPVRRQRNHQSKMIDKGQYRPLTSMIGSASMSQQIQSTAAESRIQRASSIRSQYIQDYEDYITNGAQKQRMIYSSQQDFTEKLNKSKYVSQSFTQLKDHQLQSHPYDPADDILRSYEQFKERLMQNHSDGRPKTASMARNMTSHSKKSSTLSQKDQQTAENQALFEQNQSVSFRNFQKNSQDSFNRLKQIVEQKRKELLMRKNHKSAKKPVIDNVYLNPSDLSNRQIQNHSLNKKQSRKLQKAMTEKFKRDDEKTRKRIESRQVDNSFFTNPKIQENLKEAEKLREFKSEANEYHSLIKQIKNKDSKKMNLDSAEKKNRSNNQSSFIDFERSIVEDNINQRLNFLDKLKNEIFSKKDLKSIKDNWSKDSAKKQEIERFKRLERNSNNSSNLQPENQILNTQDQKNPIKSDNPLDKKYLKSFKAKAQGREVRKVPQSQPESRTLFEKEKLNKFVKKSLGKISSNFMMDSLISKVCESLSVQTYSYEETREARETNQDKNNIQFIVRGKRDVICLNQLLEGNYNNSKFQVTAIQNDTQVIKLLKEDLETAQKQFEQIQLIKLVFYEIDDRADHFYILRQGIVKVETMFDIETITKVPIEGKMTEWNIKQQTLLKKLAVREAPEWFGYEEIVKQSRRILKVTALTDCLVLYGKSKMLLECKIIKIYLYHIDLNKYEIESLIKNVSDVNHERIGEDYSNLQKSRGDKLKHFQDGANFNPTLFESKRETFKDDNRSKRLQKWVSVLASCKSTLEDIQVVSRSSKKVITGNQYLQEKRLKNYPSVVAYSNKNQQSNDIEFNSKIVSSQQHKKRLQSAAGPRKERDHSRQIIISQINSATNRYDDNTFKQE